ncbi:DUF2092 domain-containing protein [Dokdonella sp.]|uniref:DUF2092 domain-containing protein n=1 Tax=Dokdonella sp. TaxID=2291710 RepID=UPI00352782B7
MRVDKSVIILALAGMALAVGTPALAQDSKPETSKSAPDEASDIDADAIEALNKMGTALRDLKQFSIASTTTREIVLETGEKIQFDGFVHWKVKQPDSLYVDVKSDRKNREYFYDGKDLTIYSPRLKFYTSIDSVNANLRDLILKASNDYGIELPLTDLFFWGTEYVSDDLIKSAMVVGPGTINDDKVEHYAFRQEGVDWQVWINQATNLPVKLVITTLDDPARPQYTARLNWDTSATFEHSVFKFVAPEGAHKINFVPDPQAIANAEGEGS